jgi:hypothetical protein
MEKTLAVLLVLGILVMGCAGEGSPDSGGGEMQDLGQAGEAQVQPPEEDGGGVQGEQCPEGTVWKGETYTYEDGVQVAHPICSDPNLVCPPCENCKSGEMTKVLTNNGEVCEECLFDNECKNGFICVEEECVEMALQEEGSACMFNSDCPEGMHCEPGDTCMPDSSIGEFELCDTAELVSECKERECANCDDGKYSCMMSSGPMDKRCVECFMDSMCKDGFMCSRYLCIEEEK